MRWRANRGRMWGGSVLLFSLLAVQADAGEKGETALVLGETGVAAHVLSGGRFRMADGLVVQLAGLLIPDQRAGGAAPMAPEARAELSRLLRGRTVVLSYGAVKRDRYGRALAQVHRADGLWVQGEMVRRGWARVFGRYGTSVCHQALLVREEAARSRRAGLWALDFYRLRSVSETPQEIGTFQIVTGRVLAAQRVRDHVYLNFGPDWRTDFTITIAARHLPRFGEAGMNVLALAGRRLRVRGWLMAFNGPNIVVDDPAQIEILPLSVGPSPPGCTRPAAPAPPE